MGVRNLTEGAVLKKRYRIGTVLGWGGFGITYLARDTELGQTVVVKEYFPMDLAYRNSDEGDQKIRLPQERNDRKIYQKGKQDFLKEARRMSELSDVMPVVKVLNWFEENATAYLVMEHIKGMGLDRYLERQDVPLSFQEAWTMLEPVSDALEQVHKKGMIHRDLNPGNLMLQEDGSIKIIDFGAARKYLETEKTMTVLVKRGYAPPEQYMRHGPQGPWTDIYALCATLYEMTTGVRPQPSIERMQKDELYLPSAYGAEITPEVEKVLCKGLELNPRDRFLSMKELKEALRPETQEGKKEWASGKKVFAIALALGVALCAVFVSGVYVWFGRDRTDGISQVYAGNYERGSERYREYLAFAEENAISVRKEESDEIYPEQGTSQVYTLTPEAVREWGEPCNARRFSGTDEELTDWLSDAGWELELMSESEVDTVEVQKYGAILTEFIKEEKYIADDQVVVYIQSDSVNGDLISLFVGTLGEDLERAEQAAGETAMFLSRDAVVPDVRDIWQESAEVYSCSRQELDSGEQGWGFRPTWVRNIGEYYEWP